MLFYIRHGKLQWLANGSLWLMVMGSNPVWHNAAVHWSMGLWTWWLRLYQCSCALNCLLKVHDLRCKDSFWLWQADLYSNCICFGFKSFYVLYWFFLVNLSLQGEADGWDLYFLELFNLFHQPSLVKCKKVFEYKTNIIWTQGMVYGMTFYTSLPPRLKNT